MLFKKLCSALIVVLSVWTSAGLSAQLYTLGAGDVVRISVYENPDLNTVGRISENGTISFPLIGELSLSGLSEREAERKLASLLERKQIVRSPQVSLIVEQYQSQRVSVLGNVTSPGVYPVSPGSTVVDLIAEAGGLTEQAGDIAILTRTAETGENRIVLDLPSVLEQGTRDKEVRVTSGDRIYIPRMSQFYIYGQVNRPNAYRLEPGMTVMQALSVAGGLTDKGTERGLTIVRDDPTSDGTDSIAGELNQTIQANDVIYVKESLF